MKTKNTILIFFLLISSLNSCDEGGESGNNEDDNGSGTEIVGDDGILENLRISNLDSDAFPWNAIPDNGNGCGLMGLTDGKLKRWDIEDQGLVPVKINGLSLVPETLDLIEERLGMTLFDRTGIANTADDNVTRGIIFGAEEEVAPYGYSFDNSRGCGDVSFRSETEYFYEDIELEYDEDDNVIGYDHTVSGQAYDASGNAVGNILEDTPYIFDDGNVVVGILLEEDRLLYDVNGDAICTTLYNDPLFDADGMAIGVSVDGGGSGFFTLQGETIKSGYYDAAGRINGVILVRIDTMQGSFSDNESEIEMIVNKLGYALGLGSNFDGYGAFGSTGDFEIGANFWNVLNTLYHNPIGSDKGSLEVHQIKS